MKISLQSLKKYVIITIGSFCIAFSINAFYIKNLLVDGGISGLAIAISELINLKVGILVLILNIPVFILGGLKFGKKFVICSFYGTITLSLFIDMLAFIPCVTNERLIASAIGGLVNGVGLGFVMLSGYTTGGIDIVAKLVQIRIPWMSLGKIFLIIDIIIIAFGTIVFKNIETGFYSVIALMVSTKVVDVLNGGIEYSKLFFIITNDEKLGKKINRKLNRGATKIQAYGSYTDETKIVFLSTVKFNEVTKLKEIVKENDSGAFIVIADVREIHGEGFNRK